MISTQRYVGIVEPVADIDHSLPHRGSAACHLLRVEVELYQNKPGRISERRVYARGNGVFLKFRWTLPSSLGLRFRTFWWCKSV